MFMCGPKPTVPSAPRRPPINPTTKSTNRLTEAALARVAEGLRASVEQIKAIPPGRERRGRHDDITVLVLFFEETRRVGGWVGRWCSGLVWFGVGEWVSGWGVVLWFGFVWIGLCIGGVGGRVDWIVYVWVGRCTVHARIFYSISSTTSFHTHAPASLFYSSKTSTTGGLPPARDPRIRGGGGGGRGRLAARGRVRRRGGGGELLADFVCVGDGRGFLSNL